MVRQRGAARATELARILLSGVARLNGRFGLKQVVRLLHGEREERLERLASPGADLRPPRRRARRSGSSAHCRAA
jgi:hypothetical protein